MLEKIDKYFRTLVKLGTIGVSEGKKLLIVLFLQSNIIPNAEELELKDEDLHLINDMIDCFTNSSCVLK